MNLATNTLSSDLCRLLLHDCSSLTAAVVCTLHKNVPSATQILDQYILVEVFVLLVQKHITSGCFVNSAVVNVIVVVAAAVDVAVLIDLILIRLQT